MTYSDTISHMLHTDIAFNKNVYAVSNKTFDQIILITAYCLWVVASGFVFMCAYVCACMCVLVCVCGDLSLSLCMRAGVGDLSLSLCVCVCVCVCE